MKDLQPESLAELPLEVLDQSGRTLCVLPARDVLRQKLRHRSVAIILRDGRGRLLLTGSPATGWSFSAAAALPAWESGESHAEKLAGLAWPGCRGRFHLIGSCQPCPENGNALAMIFELHVTPVWLDHLAADREKHLLLDHDSLRGLLAMNTGYSLIARDLVCSLRQSGALARRLLGEAWDCSPPDPHQSDMRNQGHC